MTTEATRNTWDVTRLAGALGAEVRGVKLSQADDVEIAAIERLL